MQFSYMRIEKRHIITNLLRIISLWRYSRKCVGKIGKPGPQGERGPQGLIGISGPKG